MDFLNKSLGQLSDLFKSMTVGARITAGLLLVAIVVSLGYLMNARVAGPDAYLFGGASFNAADLPAMEAAFSQAGLNDYELEGTRFRIPRGQQQAYVAALADGNALPPNLHKIFEQSNDKANIFESKDQRQKREIATKQQALSMIIGRMKDIESAVVLHAGEERTTFNGDAIATASVTVKPMGNTTLDRARVPGIRELVAKSFPGLTPDRVAVIDQNSGQVYSGGLTSDPSGNFGFGDLYSERKREHEQMVQRTIENALAYVPGVIVSTNVELDTEIHHEERTVSLDPKAAVPVETEESSTTSTSQAASPQGRPGLPAQGGVNAAASITSTAGSGNKSEEEVSHNRSRSVVGTTETSKRKHGLVPTRVTASIGVPSSYYEKIWHQRNPPAPGAEPGKPDPKDLELIETEENKRIYEHVLQLMPLGPGPVPDQTPLVKVTAFTQIAPPSMDPPSVATSAMAWVGESWSTLGMILLGMFGLVMLRSMVQGARGAQSVPAPVTLPFPIAAEKTDLDDSGDDDATSNKKRRSGAAAGNIKEELAEMVREDPDAAANILRNWISNAG